MENDILERHYNTLQEALAEVWSSPRIILQQTQIEGVLPY